MFTLFHTEFTIYDIATLMIVIFSTIMSIRNGFAKSALMLLAWVLTTIITLWLYPFISPLIQKIFSNQTLIISTTLGINFLIFLIVFTYFASVLGKNIQKSAYKKYDTMLGIGFGILRGFVIASLIIVFINLWEKEMSPYIRNSFVYPMMNGLAVTIQSFTPSIKESILHQLHTQYNKQVFKKGPNTVLEDTLNK